MAESNMILAHYPWLNSAIDESTTKISSGSNQSGSRHTTRRNPNPSTSSSQTQPTTSIRTPEEIDYHYIHRILGAFSDRLYDIYYTTNSAK